MRIRHICSPTAEGLERDVNSCTEYIKEHSKDEVVDIDTNFDGNMFNAYIKVKETTA